MGFCIHGSGNNLVNNAGAHGRTRTVGGSFRIHCGGSTFGGSLGFCVRRIWTVGLGNVGVDRQLLRKTLVGVLRIKEGTKT